LRASLLDGHSHRLGKAVAMLSAAVQDAIVTIRACRAFEADIAEPLSAHYNVRALERGDNAATNNAAASTGCASI